MLRYGHTHIYIKLHKTIDLLLTTYILVLRLATEPTTRKHISHGQPIV